MIVNGSSNRCVSWWSQHLEADVNEKVEIIAVHGLRPDDIENMLEQMMDFATGTKCQNAFYQMNFSPAPNEQLTEKQWQRVREIAETKHGLQGQPYFIVMHTKHGEQHIHTIHSRISLETGKAISDGNDAKTNHAIARAVEWEFGLQQVIGPYDREPGTPRTEPAPKRWEMLRGMKTGIDPRDIAAEVTALFQQSDNGQAFKAALEQHGYELVTGKRGLLILDCAGKDHSLARRIEGVNTKELNAFMRDVDRAALPTIEQAKAAFQDRKIAGLEADHATVAREIQWEEKIAQAAIEKEKVQRQFVTPAEQPPQETRAGINWEEPRAASRGETRVLDTARTAGRDDRTKEGDVQPHAQAFAEALEQKGIAFAVVTPEESYRSHREQAFAQAVGRKSGYFVPGEIVAVTEPGLLYHRAGEWTPPPRVHKLDQDQAGQYLKFLSIDKSKLKGIDATKSMLDASAQARAAWWQDIRLDNATRRNHSAPERGPRNRTAEKIIDTGASLAIGTIGKGLDVVGSVLESVLAPKLTPEQKRQGELTRQERAADAEQSIDFSRFTTDRAQEQRNHQEEQAARDRQREIERDR